MSQTRGRPFPLGNNFGRGRPKGSRNKRSTQAQGIIDQYSDSIIRKCVAKGLEGDTRALGLCMERILPPLREPGVRLRLPALDQVKDVDQALRRVLQAVANGNITPFEGETISTVLHDFREAIEGQEIVARIEELEKQAKEREGKLRDERIHQERSPAAAEQAGTKVGREKNVEGAFAGAPDRPDPSPATE
jgi:hypothetical protein